MATVPALSEDFEGGTNGGAVTTANSVYDNIDPPGGAGFSFINDPVQGALALRIQPAATTATLRADLPAPVTALWWSFYFKIRTLPAGNHAIHNWFGSTAKIGDLQVNTAGSLVLRDNNAARFTSTPLTVGEYHRVELRCTPGSATGAQLRIYSGANRHSTGAPTQDSGGVSATANAQTDLASLRFFAVGSGTSASHDFVIDRLRADDAVFPAPLAGASPVAVFTRQRVEEINAAATVGVATLTVNSGDSVAITEPSTGVFRVEVPGTGFVGSVLRLRASLGGTTDDKLIPIGAVGSGGGGSVYRVFVGGDSTVAANWH